MMILFTNIACSWLTLVSFVWLYSIIIQINVTIVSTIISILLTIIVAFFCLLFFIPFRHKLEIQMICLTSQLYLMHHSILPLLFLLLLLLLLLMVDFSVCPPSFNCPLCHTSHGLSSPFYKLEHSPLQ